MEQIMNAHHVYPGLKQVVPPVAFSLLHCKNARIHKMRQ